MANNLQFDVTFLEPDELAYEKRIRNERPPPPHAMLMSEMGILVRWIESETGDPVTIPHQIPEDDIAAEIDLCCQKLNELAEDVTTKFVLTGSFDGVEIGEAKKLASRLVHYDYRIRRIDVSALGADIIAKCEKAQRRGIVARTIVAGAVGVLTRENDISNPIHQSTSTTTEQSLPTIPPLTTVPTGGVSAQHEIPGVNGQQQPAPPFAPQASHNSTINNPLDLSAEQAPYNVQSEIQKRFEAETVRRMQEYEICVGRIEELHEDISEEYCNAMSPRRPEEAHKLMNRLLGLESVLKCLLTWASDVQFRKKIEFEISRLLRDAYILYTNMVVYAQNTNGPMPNLPHPSLWYPQGQMSAHGTGTAMPSTNTNNHATHVSGIRANSTMHQGPSNPHSVSVPLLPFERAINGLSFNLPPTMGIHDTSLSRGVDEVIRNTQYNRGQGQVAFNLQPHIIGDSVAHSQNQTPMPIQTNHQSQQYVPPPQQQYTAPTQSQPLPLVTNTPTNVSNIQINASSSSAEPRRHVNKTYHPAIATTHFPEYGATEPSEESRLAAEAQIGQLPSMNPCQGQQYLSRVLANRRYEGTVTHAKAIPLDEFIGHARAYQKSTGSPEAVVVGQLITFFSEDAFDWWQANGDRITGLSIDELESALKSRFERKSNDSMALFGEFCSRKQSKDEDLLRYIDQMLIMAKKCVMQPPLSVPQIISRIVDNSNEVYRKTLASQRYATISELSLFAEYIVRNEVVKPRVSTQIQQNLPKKTWSKPWYKSDNGVDAVESPLPSNETEPEVCDEHEIDEQINALCSITQELAKISTQFMKGKSSAQYIQANGGHNNYKNDRSQSTGQADGCWGCGAPGVYKRTCPTCSPVTKNEGSHPN